MESSDLFEIAFRHRFVEGRTLSGAIIETGSNVFFPPSRLFWPPINSESRLIYQINIFRQSRSNFRPALQLFTTSTIFFGSLLINYLRPRISIREFPTVWTVHYKVPVAIVLRSFSRRTHSKELYLIHVYKELLCARTKKFRSCHSARRPTSFIPLFCPLASESDERLINYSVLTGHHYR